MVLEFDVVIIEDETGGYVASVPSLPGCHTQAETLEEDEKRGLLKQRVFIIQRVSIPE
ncbi:MAG: type II toxin-antitoxin system HicB family antitoxin [Thermoproteota archaeon]